MADRTAIEATPERADGEDEADREGDDEHLADAPDGCGCAEVWEHLSEQRDEDA